MQIRLLGPLVVADGDRTAALGGPRQRSVLAMLALAAPSVVSTDRLVDGIWGEDPPAKPLATLQVFVHKLRKALAEVEPDGAKRLVSRPPGYTLAVEPAEVDVNLFSRWRDEARAAAATAPQTAADLYAKALSLWRGPALADLRDLPFAQGEVVRLEEERLRVEEDAYDVEIALGRQDALVPVLEERVLAHPMRERFWGQLMVALYRAGRQADALAAYARARDRLADELGIDPGEALRQLELGILRQDPALAAPTPAGTFVGAVTPADVPAEPVRPREPARVPTPVSSTVGRDDAVAAVRALLESGSARLVTLTGTGGVGKTRLASLVARECREAFLEGTWYLAMPDEVPPGRLESDLLRALTGTAEHEGGLAVLGDLFGERRLLLVLDNLEGVPDAASVLGDLLVACPGLQVLATSRVPVGLSVEHQYDVPPLPVPERAEGLGRLRDSPAVQLFVSRARATAPRFELSEGNAAGVAELCRMLDGVPLALELAAARVRLLSPAAIAEHLRSGLDLLTSTAPDLPARQRALTTTVAWSYSRLDDPAKVLCERLALFEAGFTLAAAEAVCGGTGVPVVMDSLSALVDAGLVRVQDTRVEVRFALLGTVRAYVRPLLEQHPDLPERRHRLSRLLLEQAAAWSQEIDGPAGDLALGRFDDASQDLLAALARECSADVATAVAIAESLTGYWVAAGHLTEGLAAVEPLVGSAGADPALAARAHAVCGKLAYHQTDWPRARRQCEQALRLLEATGGGGGRAAEVAAATARCYLGGALAVSGEPDRAAEAAEQALADAERMGCYPVEVVSLSILAIASAVRGDFGSERAYYERRLAVVRSRGDRARIADTLNTLAEIALDEPDAAAALSFAQESLALAGQRLPGEARDARISLARAYLSLEALDEAVEHLSHAVHLTDRTGQTLAYSQCLRTAACLAQLRGDSVACVRLFAAAQRVQPSPSGGDDPVERDFADRLATARTDLGAAAALREWTLGGTWPPAEVRACLDRQLRTAGMPVG